MTSTTKHKPISFFIATDPAKELEALIKEHDINASVESVWSLSSTYNGDSRYERSTYLSIRSKEALKAIKALSLLVGTFSIEADLGTSHSLKFFRYKVTFYDLKHRTGAQV